MHDIDWLHEPSLASKRILFARHGQYECNLTDVCNCVPDKPYRLTEQGMQQAVELGRSLKHRQIELIVTSEFLRARQTAWLANQSLGVPIVVNRLANENNVGGALEGKPVRQFIDYIRPDPPAIAAPDGESFLQMKERIARLLDDLGRSSPDTILVVTHGWPMQSVRVMQGLISDKEGALCVDMPGNCEIVEGVWRQGEFHRNQA